MQMERTRTLLAALAAAACIGTAQAGTIVLSGTGFDVDPSPATIDTTGPGNLDWGYFLPNADFLDGTQPANTDFDDLTAGDGSIDPATNSKATPGIGIVTITERDVAEYSNGNTGSPWMFSFDDGLAPVSGTQTPLGASNGIGRTEDIFTITFNDLTAGTNIVTLYMDHTATDRRFDAVVDLTAADGNDTTSLLSPQVIGNDGDGYFTFTTEVNNALAGADLAITIDSAGGNFGQFQFAGYTVTAPVTNAIPEPTSLLVGAIGLGALAARRRRRA